MSIHEALENKELNGAGIFSVVTALILNVLNGTFLKLFTNSNIPQMNFNDVLVITLSILGGIYTVFKIMNERLKYIAKKRQMEQEQIFENKIKDRMNKKPQQ